LGNRIATEKELILETGSNKTISYDSERELDEDTVAAGDKNNATGS
jgi:hypothetical protein